RGEAEEPIARLVRGASRRQNSVRARARPGESACARESGRAMVMAMGTTADVLATVPLFALLDEQERAVLAERVDILKFPAGASIFKFGDPGDSMYIVRSGEVSLCVKTKTGEEIFLEQPTKGDFFGEISLLDEGPRTAAAQAKTDVEVIEVDRGDLDELFRLK